MVRPNVPARTATSQNRMKAATNTHRTKTVSKNAPRTTSTRTSTSTQPPESASRKSVTSLDTASDKEKFMMDFIPIFDEYQKYCVNNVLSTADDGEDVENDESTRDTTSSFKLQLRHRLVSKIISLCNMNKVVSDMKHLSVIDENDDEMTSKKSALVSQRMMMITECLVHILNSAMAHLIVPTGNATANGRNTSLMASSAILDLLMSIAVEWMKEQQNETNIDCEGRTDCVEIILSLLCQYSECQNDMIRIVSVRALCNLAECIGSNLPTVDDHAEQQRQIVSMRSNRQ